MWQEWDHGTVAIKAEDEDIHTAIERRLTELVGYIASKVHTGRSRNEQVTGDMRLWLRWQYYSLKSLLVNLIATLTSKARNDVSILMPGYTHLQRAQVVRWSQWLLSQAWAFRRDAERLDDWHKRADRLPLGCGALSGNPFGVDRARIARDLGFGDVTGNSMDSTGDRDFVSEMLFWASQTSIHLSRWAEDLILYSTQEFGFVSIGEAYSTGSSLMPQKRNPDSLELIRGQCGTVQGHLVGFLVTMKGLPSTYNKDLQDDKAHLFATVDLLTNHLRLAADVTSSLTVNADRCRAALSADMLATDVAYHLIRKGVAFRHAHSLAGQCVRLAESRRCQLSELRFEDFQGISDKFDEDILKIWNYESSVEQYTSVGGTSLTAVNQQINQLDQWALAELEKSTPPSFPVLNMFTGTVNFDA